MAGKLCLSTHLDVVLSNRPCDVTKLQPCNHSEADTRIVLHLAHAADQGHRKAFVRTVDSDIVVLAVGFLRESVWQSCGLVMAVEKLTVTFQSIRSVRILAHPSLWHFHCSTV